MLLFSQRSYSKNYLFYFGGGGEAKTNINQFDDAFARDSDFALKNKKEWSSTFYYDVGHPGSKKIIEKVEKSGLPIRPFTPENYKAAINDIIKKLNSGEIKSGDNLFFNFNTHGIPKEHDEVSHRILTSTSRDDYFFDPVGVDDLEPILSLAEKKGVKIVLSDNSCYSGETLNLAKKHNNVCAISASPSSKKSWSGGYPGLLAGNFTGKTPEKIFLELRKGNLGNNIPLISTDESNYALELINTQVKNYLNIYPTRDPAASKDELYMQDQDLGCAAVTRIQSSLRELEEVILTVSSKVSYDFSGLVAAVKSHANLIAKINVEASDEIGDRKKLIDETGIGVNLEFCTDNHAYCEKIPKYKVLTLQPPSSYPVCDFELKIDCSEIDQKIINAGKKLLNDCRSTGPNKSDPLCVQAVAAYTIQKMSSDLEAWGRNEFVEKGLASTINESQEKVIAELNKAYNEIYQKTKKESKNACKNIVF